MLSINLFSFVSCPNGATQRKSIQNRTGIHDSTVGRAALGNTFNYYHHLGCKSEGENVKYLMKTFDERISPVNISNIIHYTHHIYAGYVWYASFSKFV